MPEGPSAVEGLSFGSQLDGMVVCDGDARPLRPAMIWMDRRAEKQAAAVAERMPPETFYKLVGANLDSSHAVFKALWVRDEEPEIWSDAAILMSPGTYSARGVSDVAVDPSNASPLPCWIRGHADGRPRCSPSSTSANGPTGGGGCHEPHPTVTYSFAEVIGLDA